MTDIRFGRLVDLPLRDAWKHEAHQFTPWLAENIDHLSEAIGIPLELTGTEVAVESFSADILARNPMDDSVVLIENQLEQTDHTHLGQIMTYLAGLEAQTVVWIAPAFREPHLSAIRWLNEHTSDGFSFFAIKARVVRIGDSPYAPIFEVVEKPDLWQRKLTQRQSIDLGALFEHLKAQFPNDFFVEDGQGYVIPYPDKEDLWISIWANRKTFGIYIYADDLEEDDIFAGQAQLNAMIGNIPFLEERLGRIGRSSKEITAFSQWQSVNNADPYSWLTDKLATYISALRDPRKADL
ncbi:MAG: hypothetical protein EP320_10210 [Rhodobacteraceae bacterium]|nr:MAG: hypothetical protein EP320_10210 [Paracoccaceae bacterium]